MTMPDAERFRDGYRPCRAAPYPDLLSMIADVAHIPGTARCVLIRLHPHTADQILRERHHRPWLDEYPIEITGDIPRFPGFEIVRDIPAHDTPRGATVDGTGR